MLMPKQKDWCTVCRQLMCDFVSLPRTFYPVKGRMKILPPKWKFQVLASYLSHRC